MFCILSLNGRSQAPSNQRRDYPVEPQLTYLQTTIALADQLWLLGYERDASGQLLPGATITPEHQYNLAEMGLAWHENVEAEPEFARFVEHLKEEIRGS